MAKQQGWLVRIPRIRATTAVAFAALLGLAVAGSPYLESQTYSVLHTFAGGTDGANPYAGLIRDASGNFYGTTLEGGPCGCGTVFKLDANGVATTLYSFTAGTDGASPFAPVVMDKTGTLYGTTSSYGAYLFGTVFKLTKTGEEATLHSFAGVSDGGILYAGLVRDAEDNLYGTADIGGSSSCHSGNLLGCGVVFKIDETGAETVLHAFTGKPDGANSYAGLIRDAAGNFYGTTGSGGTSHVGTVFKLDAAGAETVLYSFLGGASGADPQTPLIRDAAGNFYGTTTNGGHTTCNPPQGCGTVFKLAITGEETVLYRFTGGTDGALPFGGLVLDTSGNIYGTANAGGDLSCNPEGTLPGCGVVFQLSTSGKKTILHSFTGGTDGAYPTGGLIRDSSGNLYGTASQGGNLSCVSALSSCGVVFKIAP